MKTNQLNRVWEIILEAGSSPTPPTPAADFPDSIEPLELTDDDIKVLREGRGSFGLPYIEAMLKSPHHLFMLYESRESQTRGNWSGESANSSGAKATELDGVKYRPSKLLMLLYLFESSANHPSLYEIKISDLVKSHLIRTTSSAGCRDLIRVGKRFLHQSFGVATSSYSNTLRFINEEEFLMGKHYHDRNIVKTSSRAKIHASQAYTRFLMGDNDAAIDEHIDETIERGWPKYQHVYLGRPDATPMRPANTRPRHLL